MPGELFTINNIANIVPPYCDALEYVATTSAIEYAINVLEVENVIVCGHSNCGGCNIDHNSFESLERLPLMRKWLELIKPIKMSSSNDTWKRMVEQNNVIEQLKHLMTYPYIYEKVKTENLKLSGWYYQIETGEIFIYDEGAKEFQLRN
ncbi:carbonic anhydrase [Dethiosulfatibacter aminovorans DSM 17477]|uniref:Carbonic anhydrase n=2 Tax=Dethiosulfatibacter TaxID=448125 RepID=A0A1M6C348_9FIRM|nr:carbonic anhydrase [Dethiosulfatibacter aminovorans DSM 17477]